MHVPHPVLYGQYPSLHFAVQLVIGQVVTKVESLSGLSPPCFFGPLLFICGNKTPLNCSDLAISGDVLCSSADLKLKDPLGIHFPL